MISPRIFVTATFFCVFFFVYTFIALPKPFRSMRPNAVIMQHPCYLSMSFDGWCSFLLYCESSAKMKIDNSIRHMHRMFVCFFLARRVLDAPAKCVFRYLWVTCQSEPNFRIADDKYWHYLLDPSVYCTILCCDYVSAAHPTEWICEERSSDMKIVMGWVFILAKASTILPANQYVANDSVFGVRRTNKVLAIYRNR